MRLDELHLWLLYAHMKAQYEQQTYARAFPDFWTWVLAR